jgi:hypothetical protein
VGKTLILNIVIIGAIASLLTIPLAADVNASGFGRCEEGEITSSDCEQRAEHPETYCITIEEDPFCDDVDICDDEGDITSDHDFCTGDAVRTKPGEGCPEDTHVIEGDERGLCYLNDIPCPEGYYKILQETPNYPGDYYCDNLAPNDISRILQYPNGED